MATNYGFEFLRSEHQEQSQQNEQAEYTESSSSRHQAQQQQVQKPAGEKHFDIINFLQAQYKHNNTLLFSIDDILRHTGVDLNVDEDVAQMLDANHRIRCVHPAGVSDDVMYGYQPKIQASNKKELLALINQGKYGIPAKDFSDAYNGVEQDLQDLITSGEILAVANTDKKDKTLFRRGDVFLVELSGNISYPATSPSASVDPSAVVAFQQQFGNVDVDRLKQELNATDPMVRANAAAQLRMMQAQQQQLAATNSNGSSEPYYIGTDKDYTKEIRRGEAVWIGGQWFRVSSAVREGLPLSEQPPRAQAPLSVASLDDMSKKNEQDGYCRLFSSTLIPIDRTMEKSTLENLQNGKQAKQTLAKLGGALPSSSGHMRKRARSNLNNTNSAKRAAAAANPDLVYNKARRHGCSKDIRDLYLASRMEVPESEVELHKLLLANKLIEKGTELRRPRIQKKADNTVNGKAKKKRYYIKKGHKITNTHLEGTEIGAVLAMASERQHQGKDVGDGGM
uniref:TFA2 Winged helix domain-containing protein n=1 Tax=Leptocylindrus danicus TaxID=163516 RepID=A0A7S2K4C3_9STRA|mmetsp:Transcript_16610/g.24541  ORF Transcript_16610/g.24541 Transcript_16610/m.24541 type:complete len:509 (+) Transcript_16610:60-1586(+)